jgi:hypothetical protein
VWPRGQCGRRSGGFGFRLHQRVSSLATWVEGSSAPQGLGLGTGVCVLQRFGGWSGGSRIGGPGFECCLSLFGQVESSDRLERGLGAGVLRLEL